jgi:Metallo-peptidase family M12B Reprolysin-like
MGWGRTTTVLVVLGFSAGTLAAEEPSSPRMLGGSHRPFSINDLPRGKFRKQLESLPAPAQARARSWIQSFEFPPEDTEALNADNEGGILYTCEFPAGENINANTENTNVTTLDEPQAAAIPVVPFPDPLKYHSRPGAANVIFLDFDGHIITDTAWNSSLGRTQIVARAFSSDGDPDTYSDTEQAVIKRVWQRVAEDFAPFHVDVTTEEPPVFHDRVAHALITRNTDVDGNNNPSPTAGGVAYVNIFANFNFDYASPAWVYHNNLGNSDANIAEAASHEIGHNMGLSHDGRTNGVTYYNGHGSGATSWAPIMGTGYGKNVSEWSMGEYYMANNLQDDLVILAGKLTYRPDNVPTTTFYPDFLQLTSNRFIRASTPETDPSNINPANKGVIENRHDTDTWAFASGAGTINISARPWIGPANTRGGNLDIKMTLLDSNDTILAESDPASETIANIQSVVSGGVYQLRVENSSFGDPLSSTPSGYTDYASIGHYYITGVVSDATGINVAPAASLINATDVNSGGETSYIFSILFADNDAIPLDSLGDDDVRVTGPGSFQAAARLIAVENLSFESRRLATYAITAPGGVWNFTDNGSYSIWINTHSVADADGVFVPGERMGSFSTAVPLILYEANMTASPGWTMSGQWGFGNPSGNSSDPSTGFTGTNVVGYNLSGSYARNLSTVYATTPAINCANAQSVLLRFKRWLGVASGDTASLQILSASNTWVTIWTSSGDITDTSWQSLQYDITMHAAGRTNVQLRWGMGSNSDTRTGFGWNIDDVEVSALLSPSACSIVCFISPGEANVQGAGWRLAGSSDENWMESGAAVTGLIAGSHLVTFKPVTGWSTPEDVSITITDGETNAVQAEYAAITTSSFGVPVWWLNQFGITEDPEQAVAAIGANDIPIWQSYIAGLDPTDPDSTFTAEPPANNTSDEIVVQWNAVSGRVYSIYRMDEPGGEPQPIPDAQNIAWPRNSYTNHAGDSASGILQIRVQFP